MNKWLSLVLLFASVVCSAQTFHASSDQQSFGGNLTHTLPTRSNGDLVIVCWTNTTDVGSSNPMTAPASWTTIFNIGYGACFYRTWSTGDATTVALNGANGAGAGREHAWSATYSSASFDGAAYAFYDRTNQNMGQCAGCGSDLASAPMVANTNQSDIFALFYGDNYGGNGGGFDNPRTGTAAVTNDLGSSFFGPHSYLGHTAAVGSSTPAGTYWSSVGGNKLTWGVQVAIKPSSGGTAVASPLYAPIIAGGVSTNTSFASIHPVNGDLVCVTLNHSGTVSTTGYVAVASHLQWNVYCKAWLTGDATSVTLSGAVSYTTSLLRNINATGVNTTYVYFDKESANTYNGAGSTRTNPQLSFFSGRVNELYVDFQANSNFSISSETSSVPSGLGMAFAMDDTSPSGGFAWMSTPKPSNPTSAYTSGSTSTGDWMADAMLFTIGSTTATSTVRHRSIVY